MKRLIYLALVLCVMVALGQQINAAKASGFSITPVRFDEELRPGQTVTRGLKVTNQGEAIMAEFIIQDFAPKDESGVPQIIRAGEQNHSYSLSRWITPPQEVYFEADEEKTISFTIAVPENAEPGGHYGLISIQQKIRASDTILSLSRMGALILIRVDGKIIEKAQLESFEMPEGSIENEKITFITRLKNEGNVHLKPTGKIYLYDEKGKQLKNIIRDADYIPFNPYLLNVLPGQTRKYETSWRREDFVGNFFAKVAFAYGKDKKKIIESDMIPIELSEQIETSFEAEKSIFWKLPANFEIRIRNTGNLSVEPEAVIEFYNYFGIKKGELVVHLEEIKKGETKVAKASWDKDIFGPSLAKLRVKYGTSKQEILKEINFTVLTANVIIWFSIIFLTILGIVVYFVRSYIEMRKKFKEISSKENKKEDGA